jgi:tyrosyl-tRNA synthetase
VTHTIDDQVDQIVLGSEFGDRQLADAMASELRARLTEAAAKGRPLRVYAGYDPSKPDLHLGHSITMRKLRQFQDFGHDVIFVVGTFTAQVGDTSDKTTGRARLAVESIRAAAQTYARQAFSILDQERTTVAYNDEWLSELTMTDVANLAGHFTVQQFMERDNYRRRLTNGDPVGLHEFLYPLLQGYDAVHLRADVQLGATEQLFNIMAGRKLQQAFGQRGCVCLTYPILVGTDGVERMSKSKGNYVAIAEPANEQFGKIMSISDATMRQWLPLVTRWSPGEVTDRLRRLDNGDLYPMECKKQLAYEVVSMYHGEQEAEDARARFELLHQRRQLPDELVEHSVPAGVTIVDVLTSSGAAESRSAARRLVAGRGIRLDDTIVVDPELRINSNSVLRVGKRRFFQLSVHK